MSAPLLLYPFRKRDTLSGKWYRARWRASLAQIEASGGEWIVDGPASVFYPLGPTSGFQWSPPAPSELEWHPHRASPLSIDGAERFLATLFLRRYVTYCVRRKWFAQAREAAALHRELAVH